MAFIKVMKVAGLVAMIAGLVPLQATAQPLSSLGMTNHTNGHH